MKWIRKLIYKIFIVEMLVVGCSNSTPVPTPLFTPSPEQIDKSLFTGTPCAVPCWHGLEVGKSTEKEVITILPTLTFIDQKSVKIYRHPSMPDFYVKLTGPGVEIFANCIKSEKQCLEITTANDVLQKIILGLNYEIRPDEAIGYLGDPDYVGYEDFSAETIMCEVYLIWKDSGLVLVATFRDAVGAEKYCYVVRQEGKVPVSMHFLEVHLLSASELVYRMGTATGKYFEFTGTIPDK